MQRTASRAPAFERLEDSLGASTTLTDMATHRRVRGELVPGTRLDGYVVERLHAAGGFGAVYDATHRATGARVAIKLLHRGLSASERTAARFELEARAIAGIDHPNVVRLLDVGRLPDGRRYSVMEFLGGPTLAQVVQHRTRLTLREILTYVRPVAAALGAVHRAGYLHLDVKARNIGTTTDGRIVKLFDFGTAALVEDGKSRTPDSAPGRIGTPAIMAPELVRGGPLGPATDIYALGILLYRLWTGTHPFGACDPVTLGSMHVRCPVSPPSTVMCLPAVLDELILRCLEKDPARRYASAAEFLAALEAAAGRRPVPSRAYAPLRARGAA